MQEETTQKEIKTVNQPKKQYDWLKPYQFQKGQSGNPKGRPRGKSLKTFVRELLERMSDEEKVEYLKTLSGELVWQMAEGKPSQDNVLKGDKDNPVVVTIEREISDKYDVNPSPEGNSN